MFSKKVPLASLLLFCFGTSVCFPTQAREMQLQEIFHQHSHIPKNVKVSEIKKSMEYSIDYQNKKIFLSFDTANYNTLKINGKDFKYLESDSDSQRIEKLKGWLEINSIGKSEQLSALEIFFNQLFPTAYAMSLLDIGLIAVIIVGIIAISNMNKKTKSNNEGVVKNDAKISKNAIHNERADRFNKQFEEATAAAEAQAAETQPVATVGI